MRAPASLDKVYDVAIIGGGINGVAVARDCAMRRLSAIILEKDDLASGGSGRNIGILWPGPFPFDPLSTETREICSEVSILQKIAPSLLWRIPVLLPGHRSFPFSLERYRAWTSNYSSYASLKGMKAPVPLSAADCRVIEPSLSESITGAVSFDEWAVDPARLVVLTAKSAVASGAEILVGAKALNVAVHEGKVVGVEIAHAGFGRRLIRARTVANVAGPWAPSIDPLRMPSVKVRLSRGVVIVLEREVARAAILCAHGDSDRSWICVPHRGVTYLGAAESDYYGNSDSHEVEASEVKETLAAVSGFIPSITTHRILHAFAGVRALDFVWGLPNARCSRRWTLYDHAVDGTEGLFTLVGGTLATHRLAAEQLCDLIAKKLKSRDDCRTHLESLPGCTAEMPWVDEAKRTGIDPVTVQGLMFRHGHRAMEILESARRNPELRRTLCECHSIIAAEVEYCAREEWAVNLSALARRTGFGFRHCEGARCFIGGSLYLGRALGWDEARRKSEKERFLSSRAVEPGFLPQAEYSAALRGFSLGEDEWPAKR